MSDCVKTPVFDPADFEGNVKKMVLQFGYKSEADVPMKSFAIEAPGEEKLEAIVENGRYKTAIFLQCLSILVGQGSRMNHFKMNDQFRYLVWNCFGDEICQDSTENPETKHKAVRLLLKDGAVVSLVFRSDP